MTTRDSLLERLERANPVPDPSLLYEDVETSSQIELTEQQGREIMIETSFKPTDGGEDPRTRRGLLVGFAAVAILIGLLAFLSRSESDVAEGEIRPARYRPLTPSPGPTSAKASVDSGSSSSSRMGPCTFRSIETLLRTAHRRSLRPVLRGRRSS